MGVASVVEAARESLGPVGVYLPVPFSGTPPVSVQRAAATRIEAAGYRAAWVNETVGGKDPLVQVALLLPATERLTFGTGIANIWARAPQVAHGAAAMLAEAYPGRLVLGLGIRLPAAGGRCRPGVRQPARGDARLPGADDRTDHDARRRGAVCAGRRRERPEDGRAGRRAGGRRAARGAASGVHRVAASDARPGQAGYRRDVGDHRYQRSRGGPGAGEERGRGLARQGVVRRDDRQARLFARRRSPPSATSWSARSSPTGTRARSRRWPARTWPRARTTWSCCLRQARAWQRT